MAKRMAMGKTIMTNRTINILAVLTMMMVVMTACAPGHCKRRNPSTQDMKGAMGEKGKNTIFVYKYDGSLQCGQGKAIAPKEMAKELSGIKIYSMENKNDGLMHIQVCGSITGQANVYEISADDLEKAQKRGFKVWNF